MKPLGAEDERDNLTPRFICSHPTTSLIKHITASGKVLAFDHRGMLDTDEESAAVVAECLACGKRLVQKSWTPRLYCDAACQNASKNPSRRRVVKNERPVRRRGP